MKFDVLHNFISPVTGRILSEIDYVLVGDLGGIATPSPILIDIRLDIIKLRKDVNNLSMTSFIIGFPNEQLPNAQVLNALADGYVYNTEGTLSTTPTVIPFLSEGKLWIGDATNTPTEFQNINLNNLPPLGLTLVPDPLSPDLFVGEYYEGTSSGIPEASSRVGLMFADLALINARFFGAHFVLNSGNALLRLAMPNSQFLEDLAPGGVAKIEATGQISIAAPGTDYLDVGPYQDGFIPTLIPGPYPPNPKLITPSAIQIIDSPAGNDIVGANAVDASNIIGRISVTSDDFMLARSSVNSRQLILFDYNEVPRYTNYVSLRGPDILPLNTEIVWIMPDQQGNPGDVLINVDGTQLKWSDSTNGNVLGPDDPAVSTDKGLALWDGISGRKIMDCTIIVNEGNSINNVGSIFVSDTISCENSIFAGVEVVTHAISVIDSAELYRVSFEAPDGMLGNVKWDLPATQGNAGEVLTNTNGTQLGWSTQAPSSALYIVQAGNAFLPNAQALDQLGGSEPRILKASDTGIVEVAVEGTDYGNVSGPEPAFSIVGNIAIWEDADGRKIADSEVNLEELQVEIEAADAAAEAAQATADAAAATASAALEQAEQALFAAGAAGAGSILGGLFGGTRRGPAGAAGTPGLVGPPGAAGVAGRSTLVIDSNISVLGGRIQDIAASPQADFDAVNAKWVWDLLNDNIEIKWG